MSAVNIFDAPEWAMIFTDAAVYGRDGRLVHLTRKCHVTACGGLAIAGRGNAIFPVALAKAMEDKELTIDGVEADGGAFLDTCFAGAEALLLEKAGEAKNEVYLVGWSEKHGRIRLAQWSTCPHEGKPRFSLPTCGVVAPEMSDLGYERVKQYVGEVRNDRASYAKLGIALMKAQRLDGGDPAWGRGDDYSIGGHILRTDVTREGITQQIVHEWPEDKIGEKIRPIPDLIPRQMSRQQRRAAERQLRRAA